jgi:hypothetical protein
VTSTAGVSSGVFDIPTSIDYAVRVVPSPKHKLNVDFGILQAAGIINSSPIINLKARARAAFGISYGF